VPGLNCPDPVHTEKRPLGASSFAGLRLAWGVDRIPGAVLGDCSSPPGDLSFRSGERARTNRSLPRPPRI
jgi:hypothetical protein